MGAGLRLELRQSQTLVMTPQLQQAIKLLQMSNIELGAFVAAEIERNPLLSTEEPGAGGDGGREGTDGAAEGAAAANETDHVATDRLVSRETDPARTAEPFDTGHENLYDAARAETAEPRSARGSGADLAGPAQGAEAPDLEGRLAAPSSLRTHLVSQIGMAPAPPAVRALALMLAEEVDEGGYLRADPAMAASAAGLPEALGAEALSLLQRCEPTGVGARDLVECLALQLAERDRLDPAMRALLDRLDLLARGDRARLCKACGVDEEDLAEMLAEIRALDPRPGAGFGAEEPATVIPDVYLRRTDWGGWEVELNAETLPKVLIDQRYAAELSAAGAETRAFVNGCRESANWLIRSLDQRARTILKVATEIVTQQQGFFREGPRGLRPLSLRMVADAIGMHESTVSRVTANKYMATERGVFELKFFFSNAVGGAEGPSAEAVRERIRRLVAAETAETVLSDDQIVAALAGDGIEVARRTVAKYRKSLGIDSSVARRRRLAMGAA